MVNPDGAEDLRFTGLALRLAARAKGMTAPNPMVGAVVVKEGRVVGAGYHHRAGEPHAEVLALREAGRRARGAVLYVSLEPCAHTGRTPPCTGAILRAGIRRVVAAMIDPNPLGRGRGLQILRAHGVQTTAGVLEKEARKLNHLFVRRMRRSTGRPFVTVKVAQSLDGKIAAATGASRWISGPEARQWARRLRAESDAVLIGVETALKDDPRLAAVGGVRPLRIVLDSDLRTPPDARLFSLKRAPILLACLRSAPRRAEHRLTRRGAEILRLPSLRGRVNLKALLAALHRRGVGRLLIEGGGEAIASAFEAGVVDRVSWVIAPKILGGREAATAVGGIGVASPDQAIRLNGVSVRRLGADFLVTGDVQRHR